MPAIHDPETLTEFLDKASQSMDFAREELLEALKDANPVELLVVSRLHVAAVDLGTELHNLIHARRALETR